MALEQQEYESLQAEKRDRMNARLQHWSIFLTLIAGFGFAGLQDGLTSYLIVLYPFLIACLARHVGHNESILRQIKAYLLEVEKRNQYSGYESFNHQNKKKRRATGAHVKALRDVFILTSFLATVFLLLRLWNVAGWFALLVGCVEVIPIVLMFVWLRQ